MQEAHSPLQRRAQRFVAIYQALNANFMWDHQLVKHFGALHCLQHLEQAMPDHDRIKAMRQYIKGHTGVFSPFRGMNELMVAILLAVHPSGEAWLDRGLELYKRLKAAGFSASTYLPLSALVLSESEVGQAQAWEVCIGRMQQFYKGFKDHHLWLTSQDDYVYAALLARTDLPVDASIAEIEHYYQALAQAGIPKGNGLQSLTHVLCLGEQGPSVKVDKVLRAYQGLSERGYRLNQYHLAYVGVIALVTDAPEVLIEAAIDLAEWLKPQKGFGGLSLDKKTRFILAASLCIQDFVKSTDFQTQAVLANSLQAILLAEQMAATAAIIAATTAASASSASQ